MYTVYILWSKKDNRSYVGYTNNIERRLNDHNSGKVKSTKNRTPFVVIHTEQYATKSDAIAKELWYKSSVGRKSMRKLFN